MTTRHFFMRFKLILVLGLAAIPARADDGHSVIVIYNSQMPDSEAIARHYASVRKVPQQQLFGFRLPVTETMSRKAYLTKLQAPLVKQLTKRDLWKYARSRKELPLNRRVESSRIRYAVLCYGVPTKIDRDPGLKEDAEGLDTRLQRNEASVDSQLAALPMRDARWTGPLVNPAFQATNQNQLHPTNGILMVTRLDGPDPKVARRLVDLAIQGESNGLWGRAYFDARGLTEGALQLGDRWVNQSAQICRRWGFETSHDTNEATWPRGYLMSDVAVYVGWYAAHASGPFSRPRIDFMPGAFAYHLHSFSAQKLRSRDFNWAGPLVHRGAAATMGYTSEPFLSLTANLPVFFSGWMGRRFTLAEAAWASMPSLSWQTVVIGDPLYRPFARSPRELHMEFERTGNPLLAWSHLLVLNRNLQLEVNPQEIITYLKNLELTGKNAVLTEKLADILWDTGQKELAIKVYDQALLRQPTKPQHSRMLLKLANRRAPFGPDEKVLAHYNNLLNLDLEYPDRLGIYQKMLPIAKRVGNKEIVAVCEREIARQKRE